VAGGAVARGVAAGGVVARGVMAGGVVGGGAVGGGVVVDDGGTVDVVGKGLVVAACELDVSANAPTIPPATTTAMRAEMMAIRFVMCGPYDSWASG
jgi:hypothetical protein